MDYNYTQSNLKPNSHTLISNTHIPYKNKHKQNLLPKKKKKKKLCPKPHTHTNRQALKLLFEETYSMFF